MKENMSSAATSKFDIDEVITVLTEYGLTGTDIAAIFSHTPNIAMMRARSTASEAMKGDKLSETASTLEDTLDKALVGLLGETLRLRRYDARKVRLALHLFHYCVLFIASHANVPTLYRF